MTHAAPPKGNHVLAVLALAAISLLLALAFRSLDLARLSTLLAKLGPGSVALFLVIQLLAFVTETIGWQRTFEVVGSQVRFVALARLRIATEALAIAAPGGPLVADSLRVPLLMRSVHVSAPIALTGLCARKYLLLTGQCAFMLIALAFGHGALSQASRGVLGSNALPWVVVAAAAALAVSASALRILLSRGDSATRLRASLARIRYTKLQTLLARGGNLFSDTDGKLAEFFGLDLTSELRISTWYLATWLIEGAEAWFVLHLLGCRLDFFAVLAIEVTITFVRHLVVFVPAGLGLQDAGYALFLNALGIPAALELAAALALLKRGKELLWMVIGFGLLSGRELKSPRVAAHSALG